jgi:Tol biopolymer transport system component
MTRRTGSNSKIFLMSLDGRTQILAGAAVEGRSEDMQGDSWAQFLGDNRHIIFHSNRTGRPEVYLIDNFNPKF